MNKSDIEEIKVALAEQVSRMQDSAGKSISTLFYDFKINQAREHENITMRLDDIIKYQKIQNGRVSKNEEDLANIKKKLLIGTVASIVSLFFIFPTSRDFIISLVTLI